MVKIYMWRIGSKVKRNLYRDSEPIAMLATAELAAELATKLNLAEQGGVSIHEHERWNIEQPDGGDLLICTGRHENSQPCKFIRYRLVPE